LKISALTSQVPGFTPSILVRSMLLIFLYLNLCCLRTVIVACFCLVYLEDLFIYFPYHNHTNISQSCYSNTFPCWVPRQTLIIPFVSSPQVSYRQFTSLYLYSVIRDQQFTVL
jgi:hypothetical protein